MKNFIKFKYSIILFFIFFINSGNINIEEIATFKVVLDPGHGGFGLSPISKHGDYYDKISKKYLEIYKEGAACRGVKEHIVTYEIALKVNNLLEKTQTAQGFLDFYKIIRKYGHCVKKRIIVKSILSRPDSRNRKKLLERKDPNEQFRLFDFIDENDHVKSGRISRINKFAPHLVVSLHCDLSSPKDNRGLNAVICPPYNLLKKGMNFLKNRKKNINFFRKSPYPKLWFIESVRRSSFKWFASDTMLYFTGYKLRKNYKINKNSFKGYKYNMVSWDYEDESGWEFIAKNHPAGSQYSLNVKDFRENGKFWEREKALFEKYRRSNGIEGYGGDNCYASQEIIRYILLSLRKNYQSHFLQKAGHPYVSVWSLPLYVNAITAYIELGYLRSKRFRFLLTKKQDEIAEGIAVGIYSLLGGVQLKKKGNKNPYGKRIDFEKYKLKNNLSYFDIVVNKRKINDEK